VSPATSSEWEETWKGPPSYPFCTLSLPQLWLGPAKLIMLLVLTGRGVLCWIEACLSTRREACGTLPGLQRLWRLGRLQAWFLEAIARSCCSLPGGHVPCWWLCKQHSALLSWACFSHSHFQQCPCGQQAPPLVQARGVCSRQCGVASCKELEPSNQLLSLPPGTVSDAGCCQCCLEASIQCSRQAPQNSPVTPFTETGLEQALRSHGKQWVSSSVDRSEMLTGKVCCAGWLYRSLL
jgi:hypothetical protein